MNGPIIEDTRIDLLPKIRIAGWVVHGLSAVALSVLLAKTGVMAAWCIFPGLLIACGGAAAIPGQPITLYGAFGALMGYSFWAAVFAINQAQYIDLVVTILIVVGMAWLVNEPGWPSAIFTWVAVAISMGLMVMLYQHRAEIVEIAPGSVARTVATSVVMMTVGLAYSAVGFAEVLAGQSRRRRRKVSKGIRTPVDPPMI